MERLTHSPGMSFSSVCAWNTSRLAYDGSGAVTRGSHNHSFCTFTTGKKYNYDLSASYNIGARYFAKEIWKTLPGKVSSNLKAKDPELSLDCLGKHAFPAIERGNRIYMASGMLHLGRKSLDEKD